MLLRIGSALEGVVLCAEVQDLMNSLPEKKTGYYYLGLTETVINYGGGKKYKHINKSILTN